MEGFSFEVHFYQPPTKFLCRKILKNISFCIIIKCKPVRDFDFEWVIGLNWFEMMEADMVVFAPQEWEK
jgi:hypothetical protein